MIVCAACQGIGQESTQQSSGGADGQASVSGETTAEPGRTQPEATAAATERETVSAQGSIPTTAQKSGQAEALFSAKQVQVIDSVVYRANVSVTADKQAGKTYELKTQEEMAPVLKVVQQKIWTPTGDSWEIKKSPSLADYTLLLQADGTTQLELGLCGDLERAGYVAVKKDGKMTRYEVPVATYQQLVKAHTFS